MVEVPDIIESRNTGNTNTVIDTLDEGTSYVVQKIKSDLETATKKPIVILVNGFAGAGKNFFSQQDNQILYYRELKVFALILMIIQVMVVALILQNYSYNNENLGPAVSRLHILIQALDKSKMLNQKV